MFYLTSWVSEILWCWYLVRIAWNRDTMGVANVPTVAMNLRLIIENFMKVGNSIG